MFADTKNSRKEIVMDEGETKMSSGRIRRILKTILRALRHKSSKKSLKSMPNNIKDIANNTLEDYATVIRDAACDRSFLQSYYEIDPFSDEVTYDSGSGLFEFEDVYYCYEEDREIVIPVNFARTDAGTFFWTTAQNRIDDDLMQPLYCNTGNETAEVQFHRSF